MRVVKGGLRYKMESLKGTGNLENVALILLLSSYIWLQ